MKGVTSSLPSPHLFDLPLNPDLLEQRIGRLDRIGQTETIQLHVPYLEASAQAIMAHWYHEGLSAFEHTCPAGHNVFVQLEAELYKLLHSQESQGSPFQQLIDKTRTVHTQLNEELHKGRDVLLEYNSCRAHIANTLQHRAIELDNNSSLPDYLESVFDCFDIDSELHTSQSLVIQPGNHMQQPFPALHESGMTITYSRDAALTFEDMQYISWDHPLVTGAMEMILAQENGNTAVTAIKYEKIKPGSLFIECVYLLEAASSLDNQASRYLPASTVRIVTDHTGQNHTSIILMNSLTTHESMSIPRRRKRSFEHRKRSCVK